MSKSKTMSVPEVIKFLLYSHTILNHFQTSEKSLAISNETFEMMNMKTIYIMTFWPTRVSCLLFATS